MKNGKTKQGRLEEIGNTGNPEKKSEGTEKKSEDRYKDWELRKKDLFVAIYTVPALIGGPIDKYVDREGPFDSDIRRLSESMDEKVLEYGTPVDERLGPFIKDGVIGCVDWTKSYRMLNCIVEQHVRTGNIFSGGQLYYHLSIMGRMDPTEFVIQILGNGYLSINPFKNKVVKPVFRRYENPDGLRPNDYRSISELVEKVKHVATLENKEWKWLE